MANLIPSFLYTTLVNIWQVENPGFCFSGSLISQGCPLFFPYPNMGLECVWDIIYTQDENGWGVFCPPPIDQTWYVPGGCDPGPQASPPLWKSPRPQGRPSYWACL